MNKNIDHRTIGIPQYDTMFSLPFDGSTVQVWLNDHNKEEIWGGLDSLRLFMAVQHKEEINELLLGSELYEEEIRLSKDRATKGIPNQCGDV